ncbi:hypothetical protein LJR225_004072 [Phenylobacterium sp. LjRoot225]|uniref:hypothetical protein n=1 Tax=Phenylobacterium sp. LjRoot225 TaxID=3342285 RepID=UPI003ECE82C2
MLATPIRPAAETPSPAVRAVVRDLLTTSQAYQDLDPATRREIAGSLVRISSTAAALADQAEVMPRPMLAAAQDAGQTFSGVAADKVAGTTKAILNAVSFPRFVTELINGVFKAMNDSNQQQMASYVELIKNVAATTEGFADANIGVAGAREWLAERFPATFMIQGDEDDTTAEERAQMTPEERSEYQQERDASTRLRLRPGASMPTEQALKTAFGLGPGESVPSGDPESLVGIARAAMAKNRQQTLSTMVMMGLQRIVIDSGRLNASMRFHIDTHSLAADDRGSSFDVRNETSAEVGAKVGPWGVDAKMKNTIGYVSTERTQSTEEMNTSLDLNSSVELIFHTDYVPLGRLAGVGDVDRIRVNALNPEAEAKIAADDRRAQRESQGQAERARAGQLDQALRPPAPSPPAPPKPAEKPAVDKKPDAQAQTPTKTPPAGKTDAGAGQSAKPPAKPPPKAPETPKAPAKA